MNYNDNGEAFETIKHFIVQKDGEDVHKFRIRFLRSRHEQIIGVDELKSGEFRDESKLKKESTFSVGNTTVSGGALRVNATTADSISDISTRESDAVSEIVQKADCISVFFDNHSITATFVKTNKSQNILESRLEQFVTDNKLDIEAVKRCLNGEQKTHKGWTFNESD